MSGEREAGRGRERERERRKEKECYLYNFLHCNNITTVFQSHWLIRS